MRSRRVISSRTVVAPAEEDDRLIIVTGRRRHKENSCLGGNHHTCNRDGQRSASTIVPSIGGHPTYLPHLHLFFCHAAIIILGTPAAAAITGMRRPISHVGSADSTPNTLHGRIRPTDEEARHPHGPAGDSRLLLRRLRSVQDDRADI